VGSLLGSWLGIALSANEGDALGTSVGCVEETMLGFNDGPVLGVDE